MAEARTKVLGLPDLREALSALPDKLRKRGLRNALAAGGRVVRDEARREAPVLSAGAGVRTRKPGTVRAAINVRNSKQARRAGDVGVFVNVRPAKGGKRGAKSPDDPYYWRWLEFGWTPARGPRTASAKATTRRPKQGSGRSVPGSFFLTAAARKLDDALKAFEKAIGPAIQRLNKKGL